MKKLHKDLLSVFVLTTTMPMLTGLLFKYNQKDSIMVAITIPCLIIMGYRCYKAEYSRRRVVIFTLAFSFFVEISGFLGFIFLHKFVINSSLSIDNIYIYWLASFCVITPIAVYFSLHGWEKEKELLNSTPNKDCQ